MPVENHECRRALFYGPPVVVFARVFLAYQSPAWGLPAAIHLGSCYPGDLDWAYLHWLRSGVLCSFIAPANFYTAIACVIPIVGGSALIFWLRIRGTKLLLVNLVQHGRPRRWPSSQEPYQVPKRLQNVQTEAYPMRRELPAMVGSTPGQHIGADELAGIAPNTTAAATTWIPPRRMMNRPQGPSPIFWCRLRSRWRLKTGTPTVCRRSSSCRSVRAVAGMGYQRHTFA